MNASLLSFVLGLQAIVWPLARIGSALMTMPFFSTQAGNARVRIVLALSIALLVLPQHAWPTAQPFSGNWLLALFNEMAIGLLMGLVLQVATAALTLAGQAISGSLGLSMANMIDPTLGNVPELSQFLVVMGTLVFFGTGSHLIVIELFTESFRQLPPGTSFSSLEAFRGVLAWSSMMFLAAVLIALPVMASMLLVNVGMGIITRAAPSLNVFSVGFPATIASGLLLFLLTLAVTGNRIQWLWTESLGRLREMIGGA
jgi:flagellar biosynthetic protein FliR